MSAKDTFRLLRQFILRYKLSKVKAIIPTSSSTVIIAPHPDDETFGCAGLICQKTLLNADLTVIFLTRGESSLSDISTDEIAFHRFNTAYRICKKLGVKQILCLNLTDGSIPNRGEFGYESALRVLLEKLRDINPKEVFCTHDAEGWSDHTAAFELAYDSLRQLNSMSDLYKYWVWVWFSVPLRNFKMLNFSHTFRLSIKNVINEKNIAIHSYLDDKTSDGRPYCGVLPNRFISAFKWPYEIFEKVDYQ